LIVNHPDPRWRSHTGSPRFHFTLLRDLHDPTPVRNAAFSTPPFFVAKGHVAGYIKFTIRADDRTKAVFMIMPGHRPSIDCLENNRLTVHIRVDQFAQFNSMSKVKMAIFVSYTNNFVTTRSKFPEERPWA